ncbi:MAG: FAD-dependent oxidoreductase, partial [Actinobacteria bacterium]
MGAVVLVRARAAGAGAQSLEGRAGELRSGAAGLLSPREDELVGADRHILGRHGDGRLGPALRPSPICAVRHSGLLEAWDRFETDGRRHGVAHGRHLGHAPRRIHHGLQRNRRPAGRSDLRRVPLDLQLHDRPAARADRLVAAVRLARETDTPLSVRSGGHSVAGMSIADGGIVIDMRAMNQVTVDPATRVATVGGGATWGDFDMAAAPHALGSTGGRVSTTGVAGLTLGGGSGWAERKFGLACDSLRSVTLVTADGKTVQTSEDEHPDLFWALHGAGGNFGVATQFEFDLHDMDPNILATLILYAPEEGGAVARNYRDFVAGAPDDLGGGFAYLTAPPAPFVPADVQGRVCAGVIATWFGDHEKGAQTLKPITEFGTPLVNVQMPIPYVMFQSMLNDPPGMRNYWTVEYHDTFP